VAESQGTQAPRGASRKRGFTDFVLLEMNAQPGGNARWGENDITAYPWARITCLSLARGRLRPRTFRRSRRLGKTANGKSAISHFHRRKAFSLRRWQEGIEPLSAAQP